jgi:DNA-binding NtrC family response regulator
MTLQIVAGFAAAQSARPATPHGQAKESMAYGGPLRVLIVDDEPSICKALSMALSRAGYDAVAAQSGEAALAIIRDEHVDVMLVDFRIPDMRGDVIFELAAGFQPHLRYQSLFMTGDITDRAHQLIAACKCHFLRKPFDLTDMFDSITALAPRMHDAAG